MKLFALTAIVLGVPQVSAPKTVTINSVGQRYVPDQVTINVNDIVVFNVPRHDAVESSTRGACTPKRGGFDLPSGGSRQFTTPGTYYYYWSVGRHCQNGMVGVITVV